MQDLSLLIFSLTCCASFVIHSTIFFKQKMAVLARKTFFWKFRLKFRFFCFKKFISARWQCQLGGQRISPGVRSNSGHEPIFRSVMQRCKPAWRREDNHQMLLAKLVIGINYQTKRIHFCQIFHSTVVARTKRGKVVGVSDESERMKRYVSYAMHRRPAERTAECDKKTSTFEK